MLALATETGDADGVYPLSEDAVLRLRESAASVHLLSRSAAGGLDGYAQLDPSSLDGELFVRPPARRRGVGRALLDGGSAVDGASDGLAFWAHGDHPAARGFAAAAGFDRARVLFQMRRPLTTALPDIALPAGLSIRAFRPGLDDRAWLAVNAAAFAHHPEQGRWTEADLGLRMAEDWFDPAGFLLAVDDRDRLAGFHWTKVHHETPVPIGEIYVLGVDPGGHRRGLGAALTVAGLRHLRDRGLADAMLYVDESNTAAVALYRRMDFTVFASDVMYRRTAV